MYHCVNVSMYQSNNPSINQSVHQSITFDRFFVECNVDLVYGLLLGDEGNVEPEEGKCDFITYLNRDVWVSA